jgi:hypothetical protein
MRCGKDPNRLSGLAFLCKRDVELEASEVGLRRASWPSGRCEMLPGRVHPEARGVAAAAAAAAECVLKFGTCCLKGRRSVSEWEFFKFFCNWAP